jgi:hypothetical protein
VNRRPKLVLVAAAALFALTGCAGLRPGIAAEVGDMQITIDELDDFAKSYCTYQAAAQPGQKSSKRVRTDALATMVTGRLGHLYGETNPTTISRAGIEDTLDNVRSVLVDMPEAERDAFVEEVSYFLEGSQYLAQDVSDQAGYDELVSELSEEYDVEVDPRFGSWTDIQADGASGSLSVPVETPGEFDPSNPTAGVNASQTCD